MIVNRVSRTLSRLILRSGVCGRKGLRLLKRLAFNCPALFLDARVLVSSSLVHELDGSFVAKCVNRFCNV